MEIFFFHFPKDYYNLPHKRDNPKVGFYWRVAVGKPIQPAIKKKCCQARSPTLNLI